MARRGNNNRRSGPPKRVRINTDEASNTGKKSDKVSPTAKADQELERGIASHPMDLQPLFRHHGKKYLTLKREHYNKKNIVKRMKDDNTYSPRSARIKFTLSCLKETNERAPQRIQELQEEADQAVQVCQQALKQVIIAASTEDQRTKKKQCLDAAVAALYDLTKAHIAATGKNCQVSQKVVNIFETCNTGNLMKHMGVLPQALLDHYRQVHSLAELPAAISIPDIPSDVEEADREDAIAMSQAAQNEPSNFRLGELLLWLETALCHPWDAFLAQSDENKRLLDVRKVSTAAIENQVTDATAMLVDEEPAVDPQQLQDIIAKAVKKATEPLQQQLQQQNNQIKNLAKQRNPRQRGRSRTPTGSGASNKKKSNTSNRNNNSNRRRTPSRSNSRASSRSSASRNSNNRSRGNRRDGNARDSSAGRSNNRSNGRRNRSNGRSNRNRNNSNTRTNR